MLENSELVQFFISLIFPYFLSLCKTQHHQPPQQLEALDGNTAEMPRPDPDPAALTLHARHDVAFLAGSAGDATGTGTRSPQPTTNY
jgi:hypothetical protein